MAKTLYIADDRVIVRWDGATDDEEYFNGDSLIECHICFSNGAKYIYFLGAGGITHAPSVSAIFDGRLANVPRVSMEVVNNIYVIRVVENVDYDICIVRDK